MIIDAALLSPTARLPTIGTVGAAGYDLYADLVDHPRPLMIDPGAHALVKTNVALAIPQGYVGLICPRSGLSLRRGVTVHNGPGVIDSDYRDGIGVILHNTSDALFSVSQGDRIAQIVFVRAESVTFNQKDTLDQTDRGPGGFGHTGV